MLAMAGLVAGKSIDEIARVCGVMPDLLRAKLPEVERGRDLAELRMVGSMYQRAISGDPDCAKFLLMTKFGYRANKDATPPMVAQVLINFDLAAPQQRVGLVGGARAALTLEHDSDGEAQGFEFDEGPSDG